jgi:anti-sigma28 factor (negative regulator of flagellin synthesis)
MILYVYIVNGSEDGNIAVTGSAKKALERAATYVADSVQLEDGQEKPEVLNKAKMTELKKALKTGEVTVDNPKTEVTATVKKFNLE